MLHCMLQTKQGAQNVWRLSVEAYLQAAANCTGRVSLLLPVSSRRAFFKHVLTRVYVQALSVQTAVDVTLTRGENRVLIEVCATFHER